MLGKSHRNWHLTALALGAALLLACGNSGREIVGSWKGMGQIGYNQDVADFLEDGSCKSLEGGNRRFCSWSARPGGVLLGRYGTEPDAYLKAEIDGDRLLALRGEQAESARGRRGSPPAGGMTAPTQGGSPGPAGGG